MRLPLRSVIDSPRSTLDGLLGLSSELETALLALLETSEICEAWRNTPGSDVFVVGNPYAGRPIARAHQPLVGTAGKLLETSSPGLRPVTATHHPAGLWDTGTGPPRKAPACTRSARKGFRVRDLSAALAPAVRALGTAADDEFPSRS